MYEREVQLLVSVGFLGAYTTFSTFAFESVGLVRRRAYVLAAANILGSTVLGLLGAWILGRPIHRRADRAGWVDRRVRRAYGADATRHGSLAPPALAGERDAYETGAISRLDSCGRSSVPLRWDIREHVSLSAYFGKWLLIAIPVGIVVGSAVAFFLWLLNVATETRWEHPWLLYLLPIAGIPIVVAYKHLGGESIRGSNLVLDEIHEPDRGVTLRMAPMVLFATVATHFFGGSAGREGTAVQMGGSLASGFTRLAKFNPTDTATLLSCGIAAGFGAVFGTPLAGAVFALEVLAVGRILYPALLPCLIASIAADRTVALIGVSHQPYFIQSAVDLKITSGAFGFDPALWLKVTIVGVAFGLVSFLFAESHHTLSGLFTRYVSVYWLRPVVGGLLVILLTLLLGTDDYLGIGVTTPTGTGISISNAFAAGGADPWSWFWKLSLTVITLSSGFKGGEVTPLFFIGATLGNALAVGLHAPIDLFAALGFIAVFAGASNTPLACTIMGVELFGAEYTVFYAVASSVAYLFSGHSGIYLSQRVAVTKGHHRYAPETATLRTMRDQNAHLGLGSRWRRARERVGRFFS